MSEVLKSQEIHSPAEYYSDPDVSRVVMEYIGLNAGGGGQLFWTLIQTVSRD